MNPLADRTMAGVSTEASILQSCAGQEIGEAGNYSEPLLAAQRALRRASELAAERRYEEAYGRIAELIARASDAYGIILRLAEVERDREQ